MTSSDPQQRRREPLGFDEWIAILLAFTTIGGILWWSLRSGAKQWSWLPNAETNASTLEGGTPAATPGSLGAGLVSPGATGTATGSAEGKAQAGVGIGEIGPSAAIAGAGVASSASPSKAFELAGARPQASPTASPTPAPSPDASIPAPLTATPTAPATTAAATPEATAAPTTAVATATATPTPPPATAVPAAAPPTAVPTGKAVFTDLPADSWAVPFVTAMAGQKLVEGFRDGTFKPDAPVTRAEFAMMLSQALGEEGSPADVQFADLSPKDPRAKDISGAIKTGFMSGYREGVFRPEQQIPRWQVLLALASGLKLTPATDPQPALGKFSDGNQMPKYALNKVAAATTSALAVSPQDPTKLEPERPATRAEAIAMIHQMLVSQGKLKPLASKVIIQP